VDNKLLIQKKKKKKKKTAFDMKFTLTEQSSIFIVPFRVYLMLNHLYGSAAQYIPLAKGDTKPSTNPQAEFNPTSNLNIWLLSHFGKDE